MRNKALEFIVYESLIIYKRRNSLRPTKGGVINQDPRPTRQQGADTEASS